MDGSSFPESKGRVKSGPHVEKKLNAAFVRSAGPGRHYDGGGLYLQVDKSGARRWVLRVVVHGKRRDFGIGSAKYITLAEAREKSFEFRKIARTGGNPQIKERADEGKGIAFAELAAQVHERKFQNHRNNGKHVDQWIRTLETYAFPTLGNMAVSEILLDHIEATLRPIWQTKAETARRVLQRISVVLDDACARGYRTGGNPSVAARRSLGEQYDETKNFAAMDYGDIHHLIRKISNSDKVGAAALGFATLTAMRSGTVRLATWDQFETDLSEWKIPKENMKGGKRMKGDKYFRVPISIPARQILLKLRKTRLAISPFVFASPSKPKQPISDATMRKVLQTHYPGMTVHGMRAAFKTWSVEVAAAPDEVSEICLAHVVGTDTYNAYNRAEYFEPREFLLEKWGLWLTGRWDEIANADNPDARLRGIMQE